MINVVNYEDTPIQETPHGVDVRKLFDSEHVQVVEIKLCLLYTSDAADE